jgi:2-polyprenyl-3-methyl-5-hydroxy-6-metoxy-1,4-benzoquinol methylase
MSIGATVRRMFGRHERLIADLWRAGFIDLDHFFAQVRTCVPAASKILEIGCGEGAGTERLAAAYPDASILAIDIAPNLGRLYRGPKGNVSFRQVAVTDMAKTGAGNFDLIVMCDVLHHIPPELRPEIVAAARKLLAPGGSFIFKDWERRPTPIHWMAHAADRWLTGDRVQYVTEGEAQTLLASEFDATGPKSSFRVRPWRNNFALLMQAPA